MPDNGDATSADAAPEEPEAEPVDYPEPMGPDPSVLETRGSAWPFRREDRLAPLEDAGVQAD